MPKPPRHLQTLTVVQNNVIGACVSIRQRAKPEVSQRDLAELAGVAHTTIQRWEAGRWGKEAPKIIPAYAALMPRPDEGALWRAAVKSWDTPTPGSPMSPTAGLAAEAAGRVARRLGGGGSRR